MRGTFIKTLTELAANDERIMLLTADLGYTVLEQFSERFPDRYFNVGVAEQNMSGMATGLAEAGYIPFLYSIGTFASLRGYEFIRNGALLHNFPVRVIGVGGGLEYSAAGATHHSVEDVGVMRIQPGMRVIAPADFEQTRTALRATWDLPEPIYYRLGKNDTLSIPDLNGQFDLMQPPVIGEGRDLLIVAMGGVTSEAVQAINALKPEGIHASLAIVASLNPAPNLAPLLSQFRHVMSVEDHYIVGGVGSLVAEIIAENGLNCRLKRCGISTPPNGITGSLTYLRQQHGLSADALIQSAKTLLNA